MWFLSPRFNFSSYVSVKEIIVYCMDKSTYCFRYIWCQFNDPYTVYTRLTTTVHVNWIFVNLLLRIRIHVRRIWIQLKSSMQSRIQLNVDLDPKYKSTLKYFLPDLDLSFGLYRKCKSKRLTKIIKPQTSIHPRFEGFFMLLRRS